MVYVKEQLASKSQPTNTYFATIMLVGFLLVLLAAAASISFGAARMNLSTAWSAVFSFDQKLTEHQIIRFLRFPRTVADIIVGSSLAVAGAIIARKHTQSAG